MKRIGNLYESICDKDNIYKAYLKARKGKAKSSGVINFEKDLEKSLDEIHLELADGIYKTSEYKKFTIYDPKEREIYRLPFKDRVVHHAIMNILEDIWNPIFISQSYSCIKGRGIHGALKTLKRDLLEENSTKYCLKMDIRKYYQSVDHEKLKLIIRKKIKDKRLLDLLDGIIDSAPGIPIGNYLSQFFANLYLSYFDHWMKERKKIRYYYRYADDMVVLSSDKVMLNNLKNDIKEYLINNLKLTLKDNWQIFPVSKRGIDFIGYVFYNNHIRMRKRIKKNLCRKAARLRKSNVTAKEYRCALSSWLGWAKHCNSKNLLKKILINEKIF